MDYYDYFAEAEHEPGEVSMDEFIAEALHYQRTSRITLKNELLTCYEFLKQQDLLWRYEAYRNGEELPFD